MEPGVNKLTTGVTDSSRTAKLETQKTERERERERVSKPACKRL